MDEINYSIIGNISDRMAIINLWYAIDQYMSTCTSLGKKYNSSIAFIVTKLGYWKSEGVVGVLETFMAISSKYY